MTSDPTVFKSPSAVPASPRQPRPGSMSRKDAHLLAAWRTRAPDRLDASDATALARLLASTAILGEPCWEAARQGDAAKAVWLAIRHVRAFAADSVASDLVMGNLLLLARRGDAAAPAVIAYALRALARRRAGDRRLSRLAARWARARARRGRPRR